MNRHIRLYCKVKASENDALVEENRKLRAQLLLQQTGLQLQHAENTTSNNSHNTITLNNHITNKITNKITNNTTININAHGQENTSHLDKTMMFLLSYFTRQAITDLISCTYFDPKHPENKTVKIPSRKEKWAQTFNGSKWELHHKKDIVQKVLKDNYYRLASYFLNNKSDIRKDCHDVWSSIQHPWFDKEMLAATEEILLNQTETDNFKDDVAKLMKRKGL